MTMVDAKIPPGLMRGDTQYSMAGRWYDCNWVRFQGGSIVPLGGWRRITPEPFKSPVRRMQVWNDNLDILQNVCGTADGLFSLTKDGIVDITPAGFVPWNPAAYAAGQYGALDYGKGIYGGKEPTPFYATGYYWQMSTYGDWWVGVSTSDGRPLYWKPNDNTFATAKVIPGAPKSVVSMTTTAQRSLCVVQPEGVQNRVAISAQENIEDWDFAKPNGTAVEIDFATTAPLIVAKRAGENIIVASNTEIFVLDYVGQPFMYRQRRLGLTTLLSPNAITTAGNMVVWIGEQGLWKYDGGYIQPVECPILNDLMNDIDWDNVYDRGFMSELNYYPEVWFFYPSVAKTLSGECDRYVIWNYVDNTWVWGSLARSAMNASAASRNPFMAGVDCHVYKHEIDNDWTDDGKSRLGNVWIETAYSNVASGERLVDISRAFASSGVGRQSTTITFTTTNAPDGDQRRFGPYAQRADGYYDVRVNGRYFKMRVDAVADGPWAVGPIQLDITQGMRR
jgi:hypothetical protein